MAKVKEETPTVEDMVEKKVATQEDYDKAMREINIKTTAIFALASIQEGLVIDIISILDQNYVYKFNVKKEVNGIKTATERFRTEMNNTFRKTPKLKIVFGDATEGLENVIKEYLKLL